MVRIRHRGEEKNKAETDGLQCPELGFTPEYELNEYLDQILKVIFKHASPKRRIIFSCFHPDVVIALQQKQARYPVFFLTTSGSESPDQYRDDRCNSLSHALVFAKTERYVVPCCGVLHDIHTCKTTSDSTHDFHHGWNSLRGIVANSDGFFEKVVVAAKDGRSASSDESDDAMRFAFVGELYARRCREEELILFTWGDANR